jgi:two-component system, LuxR family, response regulator FixJ
MQANHREIALVDDDRGVRESLMFLLKIVGYQVVGYASAGEFLQHCNLDRVGGLILDQHMPHVSGLDLASRLRAEGRGFPILLITGSPSPAIVARAATLGINKVLEKPPAEAEIIAFLDRLGSRVGWTGISDGAARLLSSELDRL